MSKVSANSGSNATVRASENDPRSDFIMAWQESFTTSFKSEEQFVFKSSEDISISTTGSQVQVASITSSIGDTVGDVIDGVGDTIGDIKDSIGDIIGDIKDGIGGIIGDIGKVIGGWWDGIVQWAIDGWNSVKEWVGEGLAVILALGMVALAIYVGAIGGDESDEEENKRISVKLDKTTKEKIAQVISFDINKYINERLQVAAFGKTFRDIREDSKGQEDLSFREKIGKAMDKTVHFDAVSKFINQPLQKVALSVTSSQLQKEGFTTSKNPTGSMEDGSYRVNKTRERDKTVFKRGHGMDAIAKADIFKGANNALQKAIFGDTIKNINDNLYFSQRDVDKAIAAESKSPAEEQTPQTPQTTELMVTSQDVAVTDQNATQEQGEDIFDTNDYVEPTTTIVEVIDDALWEIEGTDGEFYFYGEYADQASEAFDENLIEGPETLAIETAVDGNEDNREQVSEHEDTADIDGIEVGFNEVYEDSSDLVEDNAVSIDIEDELVQDQQEEVIETIETVDGEVVVVDYSSEVAEEIVADEREEDATEVYEHAVELKEEMDSEDDDDKDKEEKDNMEEAVSSVVLEVLDVLPETSDETVSLTDGESIDIEFVEVIENGEEQHSEQQAEEFAEQSFSDQQDENPHTSINEGIVGDVDQDGIVDQSNQAEEAIEDTEEAQEELAEEIIENGEEELDSDDDDVEESEEVYEEPTMERQGPSENKE